MGILPSLASVLRNDTGLPHVYLPSMALLAQLSPRSTADAIMDHILGLCSNLGSQYSLSPGVTGTSLHLIVADPDGYSTPCK